MALHPTDLSLARPEKVDERAAPRGMPRVAIVVLTYKCNSRCKMCSIWDDPHARHMPMATLARVFSEPFVTENIRSVNLTGGELFLRTDIAAVHGLIAGRCSALDTITINSNATMPTRMYRALSEICERQAGAPRALKTFCYMSLDGQEEMHDRVRGVPGGYRKVLQTLRLLHPLHRSGEVTLGLNFTITRENYQDMEHVFHVAREFGVAVSFTLAMTSSMYFKNDGLSFAAGDVATAAAWVREFLEDKVASGQLPDPARFYRSLIGMLSGRDRAVGCIFQEDGFFLDPAGDVYPCWGHEKKIGNVNRTSLTELWRGHQALAARGCIKDSCKTCPNNCYIEFQRFERVRGLLAAGVAQTAAAAQVAG